MRNTASEKSRELLLETVAVRFREHFTPDNPPYAQDGVGEAGSIVINESWDVLFLESLRGLHQKRRDERERCYCVDAASSRPFRTARAILSWSWSVWTEYCIANSPIASSKVVLFPTYPAITAGSADRA